MQGQIEALRDQIGIAGRQEEALRTDLRLRLQLTFGERFDNSRLVAHRQRLAQQLLISTTPHGEIQEAVMNFFEDLGLFLRRGHLDAEMAASTFGYYAVRWWGNCEPYVREERKQKGDDNELFEDFEELARRFRAVEKASGLPEPSAEALRKFLEDELRAS